MSANTEQTDCLIIGTGVAGLMLALELAKMQKKVVILSKGECRESNSWHAQGGIATVLDNEDSFADHIQDTITAGAGLVNKQIAELVVSSGPEVIQKLIDLGVPFTKQVSDSSEQKYHLTVEGGHSKRRVIHAHDTTGQALMNTLIRHAQSNRNIKILEHQIVVDLLTSDQHSPSFTDNSCLGAYVFNKSDQTVNVIKADRTYLCTGGHGKVYLYTSNPDSATGDGLAMAWRAGCRVANLEFMQFHPTCLFSANHKNFLISEAVRGEGAKLCRQDGEYFMSNYHPLADLAPRDIVARAIDNELKKSGDSFVYLDFSSLGYERFSGLFPNIKKICETSGINLESCRIPVVPAAHYSCGGVVVDEDARTNIKNLFALGEVACTGLHGANRLASNSLLEALVFAQRAAKASCEHVSTKINTIIKPWDPGKASAPEDELVVLTQSWDEIRRLMWNYVGIVRSNKRLVRALVRIEQIQRELEDYYWGYFISDKILEVRNLALVAKLTIQCAIARKESRGIHFNIDYPQNDSNAIDTIIQ